MVYHGVLARAVDFGVKSAGWCTRWFKVNSEGWHKIWKVQSWLVDTTAQDMEVTRWAEDMMVVQKHVQARRYEGQRPAMLGS